MSSPARVPFVIQQSAVRGELQKVVKWLRKGGHTDALCPVTTADGHASAAILLHAAAGWGHVAVNEEPSIGFTRFFKRTPHSFKLKRGKK